MRIIAGESKGRKLRGHRRSGTRPTMERVRESLFAILAPWLPRARFLDLFAGTGSVGLEALSRGASLAAFVEASHACASSIRENLAIMERQENGIVLGKNWQAGLNTLSTRGERFDIVFVDPPYEDEKVLTRVAAGLIQREMLRPGGWLILQHTIRLALPESFRQDLIRVDARRFGETALTFYRMDAAVPARHPDVDRITMAAEEAL